MLAKEIKINELQLHIHTLAIHINRWLYYQKNMWATRQKPRQRNYFRNGFVVCFFYLNRMSETANVFFTFIIHKPNSLGAKRYCVQLLRSIRWDRLCLNGENAFFLKWFRFRFRSFNKSKKTLTNSLDEIVTFYQYIQCDIITTFYIRFIRILMLRIW